jgi:ABC-type amino acid transport system permease subunit
VATVVILLFAASLIRSVATNKHIEWHVVGQFLFDHRVLESVVVTLELTAVAMAVGVVLGVVLAITGFGRGWPGFTSADLYTRTASIFGTARAVVIFKVRSVSAASSISTVNGRI